MKPSLYFALGFVTVLLIVGVGYVYFGIGRDTNNSEIFNETATDSSTSTPSMEIGTTTSENWLSTTTSTTTGSVSTTTTASTTKSN